MIDFLHKGMCFLLYYSGAVYVARKLLYCWRGPSLLVFTFHTVVDDSNPVSGLDQSPFLDGQATASQFRSWLSYFTKRYAVVSLEDGLKWLGGNKTKRELVSITFDDGYESVYATAFPIACELGVPLTVFLTTDYVGRVWGVKDQNNGKRMLSWEQIREMRSKGCTFGAHTCSHPVLTAISKTEARNEIFRSKEIIEQQLGEEVSLFAYPFGWTGSFSPKHEQLVQEAGFRYAVTTKEGYNRKTTKQWVMRRVYPFLPAFVMDTCLIIRDIREQVMLCGGIRTNHVEVCG